MTGDPANPVTGYAPYTTELDAVAATSCAGQLTRTRHRIEHTRHLDSLHEDALARALTSVCR